MLIVGSSIASPSAISLERQRERVESALPVVAQPQASLPVRRPVIDIQPVSALASRHPQREGFVFSEDDFRTQRALATYASVERLRGPVGKMRHEGIDAYA